MLLLLLIQFLYGFISLTYQQSLFSVFGRILKCSILPTQNKNTNTFQIIFINKDCAKKAISVLYLCFSCYQSMNQFILKEKPLEVQFETDYYFRINRQKMAEKQNSSISNVSCLFEYLNHRLLVMQIIKLRLNLIIQLSMQLLY